MTPDDWKTLGILAGVLVGVFNLGWNVLRELRDRSRLVLSAAVGEVRGKLFAPYGSLPHNTHEFVMRVDVTNHGAAKCFVARVGGRYRKPIDGHSDFLLVTPGLPTALEPGETYSALLTDWVCLLDPNVKSLCVCSSTGRQYGLSSRALRNLRSRMEKAKQAAQNAGLTLAAGTNDDDGATQGEA